MVGILLLQKVGMMLKGYLNGAKGNSLWKKDQNKNSHGWGSTSLILIFPSILILVIWLFDFWLASICFMIHMRLFYTHYWANLIFHRSVDACYLGTLSIFLFQNPLNMYVIWELYPCLILTLGTLMFIWFPLI